eukprot:TRINITY_DN6545_c0_g1_i2.p1 TRINITY_DN6545_c0_g1~~TRINITY_DN6545_c0_g1_i2.p1  ORF type:complete len:311 (+),score=129.12 TRINITY_DN6545_c0_g1_i2:122-1054(+)
MASHLRTTLCPSGSSPHSSANSTASPWAYTAAGHNMSAGIDYQPQTLTGTEKAALTEFRREVDKWSHLSKAQQTWLDDRCLLRYLRARKFKVKDAKKMLIGTLDWRVDHKAHKIQATTVLPLAKHLSFYFHMHDKYGHPVCYMRFRRDPPNFTPDQKVNFIKFQQEEGIRLVQRMQDRFPNVEKVVYIIDLAEFSMTAPGADTGIAQKWGEMLSNHYPERLYRAHLVNYPSIFSIFWTVVSAFMDKVSVEKVRWAKATEKSKLREYFINEGFDPAYLEQEYGGDLPLLSKPNLVQNDDYKDAPMLSNVSA